MAAFTVFPISLTSLAFGVKIFDTSSNFTSGTLGFTTFGAAVVADFEAA